MVSTAARVGSINVLFTAKYDQAVAGTNRLASEVERGGARMQRSVRGIDRGVIGLNATMQRLNGRQFNVLALSALRAENSVNRLKGVLVATSALLGGFGAAFTLKGAIEYSDTYKSIGNRLRVVKGEAQDLRDVESSIFDIAQRTRSTYESTGILFSRMAGASKRLGISQRDILRVTETIQKAMLVGGATPTEAAQSSIQLSQGLASDRLQGDELRSVLENPALGQLLADRITDGDLGKLRELAAAGELTARVVINAFKSASGEIDRMFSDTEQTVTQALVQVDNALMRYIGTSENANKTSRATVSLLNAIAVNFEGIADTLGLVGAALISAYGGRGLSALRAFAVASKQSLVANAESARTARDAADAAKAQAVQTVASTKAAYEMARANTVSAATRARFGKELHTALRVELAATKQQTAAVLAHNRALAAASVSGRAFAAAGRASAAAWAFIGGGWGVALAAIGAAYYVLSSRSQEVAERTERVRDELQRLGVAADDAATAVDGTKASLEDLASDQIRNKLRDISEELDRIRGEQGWFDKFWSYDKESLGNIKSELEEIVGGSSGDVRKGAAGALLEVIRLAEEGKTPVEDLNERLNGIAEIGLDKPMDDLIQRIRSAIAYMSSLTNGAKKLGDTLGGAAAKFPMSDWRAAEDRSMQAYRAEQDKQAKFFDQLSTEAGRTQWQADVERKADEILKGAEELGLAMTRSAAKVQAEALLLKERTTANIGDAISGFVDRTIQAESGGNPNAKNPRSSATGAGQFIESTWLDQFRKVFPASQGLSRKDILDLRTNLEISKRLIENYARENAAELEKAGISVQGAADEYKLQLAHFLGAGGAIKVLQAAPGTPVSGVLDSDQITANPEVLGGGKTVDDVIAYGQKRAGIETALTREADLRVKQKQTVDDVIASLQRETELTIAETKALGESQYERLRYLYALKATQDLEEQGITVTREMKAAIDEKAAALARATVANREAEQSERDLSGAMEANKDVLGGALSDLRSALADGKLEWHELGEIALNALNKIADRLQDQFLDLLFPTGPAAAAGAGGGLFGGSGGLLGGMIIPGILHKGGTAGVDGYNHSRAMPAAAFANAPRFHSGLKSNEIAAVLEKNERVLTEETNNRAVNALAASTARLRERPATQEVAVRGVFVDDKGVIKARIERTSASAVETGLTKYDGKLKERVAEIMERNG